MRRPARPPRRGRPGTTRQPHSICSRSWPRTARSSVSGPSRQTPAPRAGWAAHRRHGEPAPASPLRRPGQPSDQGAPRHAAGRRQRCLRRGRADRPPGLAQQHAPPGDPGLLALPPVGLPVVHDGRGAFYVTEDFELPVVAVVAPARPVVSRPVPVPEAVPVFAAAPTGAAPAAPALVRPASTADVQRVPVCLLRPCSRPGCAPCPARCRSPAAWCRRLPSSCARPRTPRPSCRRSRPRACWWWLPSRWSVAAGGSPRRSKPGEAAPRIEPCVLR